jgi:cytoskeleton protein RodZ
MKRIPRPVEPVGAEAAHIGAELREARIALGCSVDELAERLRIRRVHLSALEEGRLKELPGDAYAVGFVRSYATALGLDPDEMSRRFRDATGAAAAKPVLVFPEPIAERGVSAGAVVTVAAVLAIGGYVAWFNLSGAGHRSVDLVPPVPERLEKAAEQGRAQLPGHQPIADTLPAAALPPPGGLTVTAAPAAFSGANTSAQAATVPAAPAPAPLPAPEPAVAAAPPAPTPVAIPGVPEGTRIVLRARTTSLDGAWVHVRDPRSGQVLVNRVLRPGEAWPTPLRDGLLLDTGKADGLEILVDGQPQPTLEGLMGVRRNIALEPEKLRQRLIPVTVSAAPATIQAARNN